MSGRLRRMRCTNCPMPMEAVSPSPLTPRAIKLRLASRIEAVGAVHEVSGTLRRATDSAQLRDPLRLHAHVIHGFDDALGDGVMAATGAQSGLAAFVVDDAQSNAVCFRFGGRCGRHYFPSIVLNSSVTERASSGSPSRWLMLRRRVISSGFKSSLSRLSICASRFCSTT